MLRDPKEIMIAPSEDRTHDPWFTRPVLYPLSYGGHVHNAPKRTSVIGAEHRHRVLSQ